MVSKFPPRRRDQSERIPLWSWTVLMAIAAAGIGMWYPPMEHWRRQMMGWSLLAILLGWLVKFGHSTLSVISACIVAIYVMFGGPLHMVSQLGYDNLVQLAADSGMDINARGLLAGSTPLHLAATAGHFETVRLLLDKGADVHAAVKAGETALHVAAWEGHTDTVNLLLDKGANIDAQDGFGQTALHRAAWVGRLDVVELLISRGARGDVKDLEGVTAIDLTPSDQVRRLLRKSS